MAAAILAVIPLPNRPSPGRQPSQAHQRPQHHAYPIAVATVTRRSTIARIAPCPRCAGSASPIRAAWAPSPGRGRPGLAGSAWASGRSRSRTRRSGREPRGFTVSLNGPRRSGTGLPIRLAGWLREAGRWPPGRTERGPEPEVPLPMSQDDPPQAPKTTAGGTAPWILGILPLVRGLLLGVLAARSPTVTYHLAPMPPAASAPLTTLFKETPGRAVPTGAAARAGLAARSSPPAYSPGRGTWPPRPDPGDHASAEAAASAPPCATSSAPADLTRQRHQAIRRILVGRRCRQPRPGFLSSRRPEEPRTGLRPHRGRGSRCPARNATHRERRPGPDDRRAW